MKVNRSLSLRWKELQNKKNPCKLILYRDFLFLVHGKNKHIKAFFRLSSFLVGIIFYTREVLLTSHYEKRLFEHASQPRVAGSDIRLLSYLWS